MSTILTVRSPLVKERLLDRYGDDLAKRDKVGIGRTIRGLLGDFNGVRD